MPASAASVVAKLATNPSTAQTVPKSLRNLRPLREKKHRTVPYSTQRAQRTQNIPKYGNNKNSTENLRAICGLCVKTKHRFFPNSTQRAQRTQSSIYIKSCQSLRETSTEPVMPASATSVVAKLATNPATAQTVPKSLRPLREKAQSPSLFHAENAEHNQVTQQQRQYRISPRNLRTLRETKHRTFPYSTQRTQRTQSSIYIYHLMPTSA